MHIYIFEQGSEDAMQRCCIRPPSLSKMCDFLWGAIGNLEERYPLKQCKYVVMATSQILVWWSCLRSKGSSRTFMQDMLLYICLALHVRPAPRVSSSRFAFGSFIQLGLPEIQWQELNCIPRPGFPSLRAAATTCPVRPWRNVPECDSASGVGRPCLISRANVSSHPVFILCPP